jgi:hypothetical protein
LIVKLVSLFDEFLKDTVNLNKTRIDLLENSIPALKSFVRESGWTPKVRGFEEQGSWAHQTIIRPVDGGEFDADLLVMVDAVEGWTAAEYVESLGRIFAASKTYAEKAKTYDYCVTITYAGDRKVDLAPCVVGRRWQGSMEVCNRKGGFEQTSPIEYTAWMKERNAYSGSNSFRKVTRLLKYLRDIKGRFTCPSVLLTTLIGYRIEFIDQYGDDFCDVPTTLKTVIGRLDDWLQPRPVKPSVPNPKLTSEDFSVLWKTQEQYANFRDSINRYRKWVDEAYDTKGRQDSIAAWQKLFGEDFGKGDVIKAAADERTVGVVSEGASLARRFMVSTAAHSNEIVDVVRNYGVAVLPPDFARPVHIKAPRWRRASSLIDFRVVAEWRPHRQAGGTTVNSGQLLQARGGLFFRATASDGAVIPGEYAVEWRITNTGAMALAAHQGRGDFEVPNMSDGRWEPLKFRGIHMAEAFVVRRSNDELLGFSPPFFVVIE